MRNKYEELFKPGKIGKMQLKNRIVMSPMGTSYAESDGKLSQTQIDYYEERARGGVGMIILEGEFASRQEGTNTGVLYLDDDKYIPRLYELTEAVHAHGTKICAQIGCGYGRIFFPVSASAVPTVYDPNVTARPLT